jgi:hypothetical protein
MLVSKYPSEDIFAILRKAHFSKGTGDFSDERGRSISIKRKVQSCQNID